MRWRTDRDRTSRRAALVARRTARGDGPPRRLPPLPPPPLPPDARGRDSGASAAAASAAEEAAELRVGHGRLRAARLLQDRMRVASGLEHGERHDDGRRVRVVVRGRRDIAERDVPARVRRGAEGAPMGLRERLQISLHDRRGEGAKTRGVGAEEVLRQVAVREGAGDAGDRLRGRVRRERRRARVASADVDPRGEASDALRRAVAGVHAREHKRMDMERSIPLQGAPVHALHGLPRREHRVLLRPVRRVREGVRAERETGRGARRRVRRGGGRARPTRQPAAPAVPVRVQHARDVRADRRVLGRDVMVGVSWISISIARRRRRRRWRRRRERERAASRAAVAARVRRDFPRRRARGGVRLPPGVSPRGLARGVALRDPGMHMVLTKPRSNHGARRQNGALQQGHDPILNDVPVPIRVRRLVGLPPPRVVDHAPLADDDVSVHDDPPQHAPFPDVRDVRVVNRIHRQVPDEDRVRDVAVRPDRDARPDQRVRELRVCAHAHALGRDRALRVHVAVELRGREAPRDGENFELVRHQRRRGVRLLLGLPERPNRLPVPRVLVRVHGVPRADRHRDEILPQVQRHVVRDALYPPEEITHDALREDVDPHVHRHLAVLQLLALVAAHRDLLQLVHARLLLEVLHRGRHVLAHAQHTEVVIIDVPNLPFLRRYRDLRARLVVRLENIVVVHLVKRFPAADDVRLGLGQTPAVRFPLQRPSLVVPPDRVRAPRRPGLLLRPLVRRQTLHEPAGRGGEGKGGAGRERAGRGRGQRATAIAGG
eukprot:31003-Pelagococcus_subviridis.AAC.3